MLTSDAINCYGLNTRNTISAGSLLGAHTSPHTPNFGQENGNEKTRREVRKDKRRKEKPGLLDKGEGKTGEEDGKG